MRRKRAQRQVARRGRVGGGGQARAHESSVGGSLAAPGWGDIIDWLARTQAKASGGAAHAAELAAAYGFIYDVLPETGRISVRRARATIARASYAEAHRRKLPGRIPVAGPEDQARS